MFAICTILRPIDFSRRSEYAFCVACACVTTTPGSLDARAIRRR